MVRHLLRVEQLRIVILFNRPFSFCQERTIERLKEQRDRDEREKQEEIDNYKKDLKDLKEKVSFLQGDLSEKEVRISG